jgi:proteasome accessory factor C
MNGEERFIEINIEDDDEDDDTDHIWIATRDTLGIDTPLRFTNEQIVAIMGGLKFLESQPQLVDREAVSSLIEKLSAVFGDVESGIQIDIEAPDEEIVATLNHAIKLKQSVEIEYGSVTDNKVSTRIVEPSVILVNENAVTVRAYCHEAQDIRSFRVDRILKIKETGESATHLAAQDDGSDMPSAQLSVKLLMDLELLEDFAPQTILDSKIIGDQVEAHIRVSAFSWVSSVVLASAGAIKVLEPPQLREVVLEKAERWAQLNGH